MSKSSNSLALVLLAAALTACQSVPEPAPQPEIPAAPEPVVAPEPAAETEVPPGTATETAPETAAEIPPEPEPVDFNQQFYNDAIASLKSGKPEVALELLLQVSSDAPDKPFVFTNLGLAYFKLQKLDLAEQAFSQAIERNDGDAVAYNHLGILLRQKGDFEKARQHYQRAIDIDSGYARAWLNLGILYDMYLQDLGKALRHYQRYQALAAEENKQVAGWIIDLERRLKSSKTSS